jgi:hypothetical protein
MELEVKHLIPYLPYGLKCQYIVRDSIVKTGTLVGINHRPYETHPTRVSIDFEEQEHIWMFKPILRPLKNLGEIIEHNGETFCPIDWIEDKYYTLYLHEECKRLMEEDGHNWINHMSYLLIQHLFEWHFDVFGLINEKLAVELN